MTRYLAIKDNDIDNGPGLRVSVWFSGCPHKCRGCHNEESWDETRGKEFTNETIDTIIEMLNRDGLEQDLSILGGEPLAPYNIKETVELINQVSKRLPKTKIWLWTGYTLEELDQMEVMPLLNNVDVIIEGRYVEYFKIDGEYRGSSNQRIINNKKSLSEGKMILA